MIHPTAQIDPSAVIGNNVRIYQAVTLASLS